MVKRTRVEKSLKGEESHSRLMGNVASGQIAPKSCWANSETESECNTAYCNVQLLSTDKKGGVEDGEG